MNPTLFRLVRVLAELYPDIASTIFFMAEAGIDGGRILAEESPRNRWYAVIDEAQKAGQIAQVMIVALADYPAHPALNEIGSDLRPVVALPEYDLAHVIPPTLTGQQIDRIVGGRLTTAFPDVCAVGSEQGYFCSGTLIRPDVVLTAKHCAKLANTRVFLAGYDLSIAGGGEIGYVGRRVLHPVADIMLLFLEQPATVAPRRIATSEEIDGFLPLTCTLVGFGTIDFQGTFGYGVKRRVEVPITALLCGGSDDEADFKCLPGLEMVAGHRGLNRDSCHGDSGGPLLVQGPDGEYMLLGVTSRGAFEQAGCGDGGIYVRADKFADWIEAEVGGAIAPPECHP